MVKAYSKGSCLEVCIQGEFSMRDIVSDQGGQSITRGGNIKVTMYCVSIWGFRYFVTYHCFLEDDNSRVFDEEYVFEIFIF